MMTVKVDTSGADALERKIPRAAKDAVLAMARIVFRASQANVPVDQGHLKASARVEPAGPTALAIRYGGGKAKHAVVVEHTPDRPGFSFLRRSLMETARAQLKAAAAVLKASLR